MDDLYKDATSSELQAEALVTADLEFQRSLYDARIASGINLTELARRMGVPRGTAMAMETQGYEPRLSELRRYAMAVGVVYRHAVFPFELNPEHAEFWKMHADSVAKGEL